MSRGRPFRKGQSGNPKGRPKGIPNKATREAKELCRWLIEDEKYREKFLVDWRKRNVPAAIEEMVWHYCFGKPPAKLQLSNPDGSNLFPGLPDKKLAALGEAAAEVLRKAG